MHDQARHRKAINSRRDDLLWLCSTATIQRPCPQSKFPCLRNIPSPAPQAGQFGDLETKYRCNLAIYEIMSGKYIHILRKLVVNITSDRTRTACVDLIEPIIKTKCAYLEPCHKSLWWGNFWNGLKRSFSPSRSTSNTSSTSPFHLNDLDCVLSTILNIIRLVYTWDLLFRVHLLIIKIKNRAAKLLSKSRVRNEKFRKKN